MLLYIMKNDWRTLRADRTLYILTALFILFIGYGIYNGARWTKARRAATELVMREGEERLQALQRELATMEASGSLPQGGSPFAATPNMAAGKCYPAAAPPS